MRSFAGKVNQLHSPDAVVAGYVYVAFALPRRQVLLAQE